MKRIIILLIAVLVYASCTNNGIRDIVYYEKSFAEAKQISQNLQLPFCMVLYDSLQNTTLEYLDKFHANKLPLNKGVFNFVNITADKNKWYNKLLSPQTFPVTCIFSPSGELLDLIPGNSKESVLYTDKVLTTHEPTPEFHYNKKYGTEKMVAITQINQILKLKFEVDDKRNVVAEIDSLITKVRYPYPLFLKLQNQLQFNDSVGAIETARELLLFDSAKDLFDYYDELMFANHVIDLDYTTKTAPLIEVNPAVIELKDCKINEPKSLTVHITNKGEKPLKISEILTSCSCVKLISSKRHMINPNQFLTITLEFTPDVSGDILREVYIASNSVNSPISIVTINASAN